MRVDFQSYVMKASIDENWLWHERFGHFSFDRLELLHKKDMVDGLELIAHDGLLCKNCIRGKHHRNSFLNRSLWKAKSPLDLVRADVCGPMQTLSLNNNVYFVVFVDDYS